MDAALVSGCALAGLTAGLILDDVAARIPPVRPRTPEERGRGAELGAHFLAAGPRLCGPGIAPRAQLAGATELRKPSVRSAAASAAFMSAMSRWSAACPW